MERNWMCFFGNASSEFNVENVSPLVSKYSFHSLVIIDMHACGYYNSSLSCKFHRFGLALVRLCNRLIGSQ